MKLLKQLTNILLAIAIFGLVPVVLFVFITSRTPILFGIRSYVVMTGSMVPKLPVGSMVFTTRASIYNVGDIITFKRGNISVTHRIYEIRGNQFVTKGDANNAPDSQLVSRNDIVGRDVAIVPFIGRFTGFLKTPLGFFLLLGVPTLLFVFFEALEFKREWEKEVEKKIIKKMYETNTTISA